MSQQDSYSWLSGFCKLLAWRTEIDTKERLA